MQEMNNSLLNNSHISLQDLHTTQIHTSHMNNNNNNDNHSATHFDPGPVNDDFFDQMLSNLPSYSWPDLTNNNDNDNNKPLWDPLHVSSTNITDADPADLSDETAPPSSGGENGVAAFHYDEHATLASKFRNHQIGGISPTAKAAALMLQQQQQQLLLLAGNDVVDAPRFKSHSPGSEASVQALFNGLTGSQHFQHSQGQNFGGTATNQALANGGAVVGGGSAQPKQRVRARRGQATDPHSIAERLRRERIAERMKALQELVPNANKTDKASMLEEIIDYVKFLQLQVKVLSMSRLGGAAAVAPLVAEMPSEVGADRVQTNGNGIGALSRNSNGNQSTASTSNDSVTMTEEQVAKLMEKDMGSAMQYLQGKGLCLMPISLATVISTVTCRTRNPLINAVGTNCEGPSSPNVSVLTVQSGNDGTVKDAASFSKP